MQKSLAINSIKRSSVWELYISVSLIYIFLVCLDGEDVKPKWKQWLADQLSIKPKIEVRYIKPQVIKLHSRVAISTFETHYYSRDKSKIEQLKKRAIECVYEEILKKMMVNNLVSISQYNDIYSNNIIYEGTCSIYKN
nr:MAG TPA: hypothetical protein [Crassvirales sp.]